MKPDRSPGAGAPRLHELPPLLTFAIPTFNRADYLRELLEVLLPQVAACPQVEVLVVDNAGEDHTPQVTAEMQQRFTSAGAHLRVERHDRNIGSDANFAFCFRNARGKFFWLCGDDDLPVPGSLARIVALLENTPDLDMIYVTSYGFRDDFLAERQHDPLGRTLHTITDARQFASTVNVMFTFISSMIANKQRLEQLPHEEPEAFIGTNLVQLSWLLPLLLHHRRSLVDWTRLVAGRQGNAQGYSLGRVFGEKLKSNVERLLPGRKDLQNAILHPALRRWFPSTLIETRISGNRTLGIEETHATLLRVFGHDPRYWLFIWPALAWPLPLAKLYTRLSTAINKAIYILHLPGFWRKQT